MFRNILHPCCMQNCLKLGNLIKFITNYKSFNYQFGYWETRQIVKHPSKENTFHPSLSVSTSGTSFFSFLVPSLLAFAIMLYSVPLERQRMSGAVQWGYCIVACSFWLFLFLALFNCFSMDPPPDKISFGIVPIQHGFFHELQPLQRCTISCIFFCVSSCISRLSLQAYSVISPIFLFLHWFVSLASPSCLLLRLLSHLLISHDPSHPSSCIFTCAPWHIFLCRSPLLWCFLSLVSSDFS